MPNQTRSRPGKWSIPTLMAGIVLILAVPAQAQGTLDPCTVRANYDQAQAAAKAAEEASKKLVEPDWDKLTSSLRSQYRPHILVEAPSEPGRERRVQDLLRELKTDLQTLKKSTGGLSLQQAQAKLDAAEKQKKALESTHSQVMTQIERLDKDPSMPESQVQQLIKTIDDSEAKIIQMVGESNIAVARYRPDDPNFSDFKSPQITQRRLALDKALSDEAKQSAQLALEEAIGWARLEAKKAVMMLDTATEGLVQLGWVEKEVEQLVRQKAQKQRELLRIEADIKNNDSKFSEAFEQRRKLDEAEKIGAMIRQIEPWLNTRLKRDQAEEKVNQVQQDYWDATEAKNKLLDREKARFNQEQTRINQTRTSLQGQAKDQAYYQKLSQMTLHARATYELLLLNLVDLDCFGDVRNFMDDIKARMKKLDEAREQILKEASAVAKAAAAKPAVVRGAFVRTGVVPGRVPGPGENNDAKFYGSISANSFSFTAEYKPPYEGKANVSHSWQGTPPANLKPGDIITLSCSSKATRSGRDVAVAWGSCGWQLEGKVEILKVGRRLDSQTEKGKVVEENKGTFAGTASSGVFYPSSAFSVRFKILPGAKGDTIIIRAWQAGSYWGTAEDKPVWNPAEYKYRFNP